MQPNEFEAFAKQMMVIGELYKQPVSEHMAELYWAMLESYEFEDIKRAIMQHGRNADQGRFMPKPADLVKIIDGGGQAKAQLAWSKVCKAMGQLGSGRTVVFDDALIHAVITDMEGWMQLCQTDDKALPFRAREFEQRYAAYLLKPPESYPKQLSGLVELHNSAHNFPERIPEPYLFGESQKAKLVFESGDEPEKCYQLLGQLELPRMCQALPSLAESEAKSQTETTKQLPAPLAETVDTTVVENDSTEQNNAAQAYLELKKVANGGG